MSNKLDDFNRILLTNVDRHFRKSISTTYEKRIKSHEISSLHNVIENFDRERDLNREFNTMNRSRKPRVKNINDTIVGVHMTKWREFIPSRYNVSRKSAFQKSISKTWKITMSSSMSVATTLHSQAHR